MKTSRLTAARARERLGRACRAAGLPVTPQRAVIYQSLVESLEHPSPEALYTKVREQIPGVSLDTIYKTLDVLVRLRLARELASTGDCKRFDGRLDGHHHLVCRGCGSIRDLEVSATDAQFVPQGIRGFQPEQVSVLVHGLCMPCAAAA
jgi:Fur family transcriptional regulator, peroxide stress response regulator